MGRLNIELIPCLSDNYTFFLSDPDSDFLAIVDPSDKDGVMAALEERNLTPTHILNTHHHWDHAGSNLAFKKKYGVKIVGPRAEADKIPGLDLDLGDGDLYDLGGHEAKIFDVPGHTAGHIAYWFGQDQALFCGDTLFALGCGRLFEGTPKQMWSSLSKLLDLPDDTRVYCAHEYTQSNARFAVTVEPGNQALQDRAKAIDDARAKGEFTVPSTIGLEKATNPFLRPDSPDLQKTIGLDGADLVEIFAETRRLKDNF